MILRETPDPGGWERGNSQLFVFFDQQTSASHAFHWSKSFFGITYSCYFFALSLLFLRKKTEKIVFTSKKWFRPANCLQSTPLLVEIHNTKSWQLWHSGKRNIGKLVSAIGPRPLSQWTTPHSLVVIYGNNFLATVYGVEIKCRSFIINVIVFQSLEVTQLNLLYRRWFCRREKFLQKFLHGLPRTCVRMENANTQKRLGKWRRRVRGVPTCGMVGVSADGWRGVEGPELCAPKFLFFSSRFWTYACSPHHIIVWILRPSLPTCISSFLCS